jgi:hypothetical protein
MEDSKNTFIQLMIKSNPKMTDTTINHHINRIRYLKKVLSDGEFEDYDANFLDNKPQNIIKSIYNKWNNNQTRKTYIYTCVSASKAYNLNDKIINYYKDEYNKIYNVVEEQYNSKEPSEKQKNNMVKLDDIDKLLKNLKKKVDLLFEVKSKFTLNDVKKVREYILLLIYRNFRFRNDLSDMRYLLVDEVEEYEELYNDGRNYLIYDMFEEEMFFLINEYKTKNNYGTKKIIINNIIAKELKRYMEINPTPYLIFNQKQKPATSHELTILLSLITKKYFDKSITSTMFNVIISSEKFSKEEKERIEDAKQRGHSLSVQHKYIKIQ